MLIARRLAVLSLALGCFLAAPTAVLAETPAAAPADRARKLIDAGLGYLRSQQTPDGAFATTRGSLAISALCLKAFARNPATRDADFVARGFDHILANQLETGGIYKDTLASYNTAIAVSALASANNPKYQPAIDRAIAYLKALQWSDTITDLPKGEQVKPGDPRIGGWGYGSKGRPDGSNTAFAIDALKDAGLPVSDPAFTKAAEFMSNCQNLASNPAPWARGEGAPNDGGFIYSPAFGGETFAGDYTDPSGVKRFNSYGTMTYAGLKSLLYANISKSDPRVVAAHTWISKTFTVTANPGMEKAGPQHATDGLYYYYHILARALTAYGQPVLNTPTGPVDWRLAVVEQLEKSQAHDGSWQGTKPYLEENKTLVTAYSVLALQELLADLEKHPAEKHPAQ